MSENIFSNFYNKVLSFFQKDAEQDGETAKDAATNRLKLVLMQDRSNLDGATMQKMREQLINVISRYVEIDQEALDLNLEADGEDIALMLNIPVIRARTREEIEELEAKEQEELKSKNETEEEAQEDLEESDDVESQDACESSDEAEENSEQVEQESENEDSSDDSNDDEVKESEEVQEELTSDEDTTPKKSKKHKSK